MRTIWPAAIGILTAFFFSLVGDATASTSIHLHGTLRGIEQRTRSIPDTGMTFGWQGHGHVAPLGTTQASGNERAVGFIRFGHPTASLTLTDTQGTLTVRITYARTAGFAAIPATGHYLIMGGTGAYAGATGKGNVKRVGRACTSGLGCTFPVRFTFH